MGWIDTDALKHDRPVEEVIERYGVELRQSGCALIGRCPFHEDGGRPNLYVYPSTRSWYCYRCGVGGDVISFVERIERIGFRNAVMRLTGDARELPGASWRPKGGMKRPACRRMAWGPGERCCLATAVELYHNRLLSDVTALKYVRSRGLDHDIIQLCRLGYAAGDELVGHLRWHGLPIQAALRIGLLRPGGREFLAGRIVVPEIREGQPVWIIGRTFGPNDDRPKYLGLPGNKPLLGWETAKDSTEVFLVEGVFDWLTLVKWGYPALALVGTHVRPAALEALARFERILLLLDNDEAGQEATADLAKALGSHAAVIRLPGVKDVAELGIVPEGLRIFARAVAQSDLAHAA